MTICAGVKVREGLILGTDSMTQIWGQDQSGNLGVIKTYANAQKLFQVAALPIGLMTYGIGNLGPRSIQGLINDFNRTDRRDQSVKSVTLELFNFIKPEYDACTGDASRPPLGFYVAGYSPEESLPEEWEFVLPKDEGILRVRPEDKVGASWRGSDIPFTRLYKGYDPRMLGDLLKHGVKKKVIDSVIKNYESPVAYDGMPVQDAINFVGFILRTTIGVASFEVGPPGCGGPLQLAVILPERGFVWLQQLEPTVP